MLELIKECDAIVLTGGESPQNVGSMLLSLNLPLIVADSGLNIAAAYGMTPTYVVGDADSMDRQLLSGLKEESVLLANRDKDDSDTALALQLAYQNDYRKVLLLGGGGRRVDHLLANIMLMASSYAPFLWITAYEIMKAFDKNFVLNVKPLQTLSFYALIVPIKTKTQGLEWPLNKRVWQKSSISLSNRATQAKVSVAIEMGKLVVIMPYTVNGDHIEWL